MKPETTNGIGYFVILGLQIIGLLCAGYMGSFGHHYFLAVIIILLSVSLRWNNDGKWVPPKK